jgi:hypothetical protein
VEGRSHGIRVEVLLKLGILAKIRTGYLTKQKKCRRLSQRTIQSSHSSREYVSMTGKYQLPVMLQVI